jgi:hypothetical protein
VDRKPPTAERVETFLAWVCSDPKCDGWGRDDDRPAFCFCGERPARKYVRLVAASDVERLRRYTPSG